MAFFNWNEIPEDVEPGKTLPAGMSRRGFVLGDMMPCLHEALPNLKCAPHSHPSSQFVIMLQGKLRLTIAGEGKVLGPGEVAFVPGGVEHAVESLDEYVKLIDIFQPPRQDILARLEELGQ